MPQMSPMYWLILMFYFVMMLILVIMFIYFMILMKPKYCFNNLSVNKMNWLWYQTYFRLLIHQLVFFQ